MKIEEKFNKRSADLIEVQMPSFRLSPHEAPLGVKLEFFPMPGTDDGRTISMHVTPDEALQLAEELIAAARRTRR